MDELKDTTPIASQIIVIKKDILNNVEAKVSAIVGSNLRTRRIKKPKQIEDLGFEEKQIKVNKNPKKNCKAIHSKGKINKKKEICHLIFQKLKESEYYSRFPLLIKIEKQLKLNNYQKHKDLASDIRNVFNNYFTSSVNNPQLYSETVTYSQYFENIYKDYENKVFSKDSKNVLELKKKMNRLRREIRERNTNNIQNLKNNKLRIDINDYNLLSEKDKPLSKKYKISLVNNIKSLNKDQIKGVINIIHDNLNVDDKTMEFDINNLPFEKLKELDKYVKKCLKIKSKNSNNLIKSSSSNFKSAENINVNININNNFMLGKYKTQNFISNSEISLNDDVRLNLKKRNSILSETDSLSSDEESDSNSLSSLSMEKKKRKLEN